MNPYALTRHTWKPISVRAPPHQCNTWTELSQVLGWCRRITVGPRIFVMLSHKLKIHYKRSKFMIYRLLIPIKFPLILMSIMALTVSTSLSFEWNWVLSCNSPSMNCELCANVYNSIVFVDGFGRCLDNLVNLCIIDLPYLTLICWWYTFGE